MWSLDDPGADMAKPTRSSSYCGTVTALALAECCPWPKMAKEHAKAQARCNADDREKAQAALRRLRGDLPRDLTGVTMALGRSSGMGSELGVQAGACSALGQAAA